MAPSHRILLVEDSETQALKMRALIEDAGLEMTWSDTAEKAQAELNKGLPHLIIMDYYLPGIRGDELCRQIRMNVETRGVPILMLTAEEAGANEIRGLESGADDYVSKSVEDDVLVLRIRSLLRKTSGDVPVLGGKAGRTALRQHTLLAVDDSPTYLAYLAGELAEEGYKIETAAGGKEALGMLDRKPYDCVLVDLMMPDVDGIGVCRHIDSLRPKLRSPVVVLMLTAREGKEDLTRALEAGADDFVGKSNDVAVLKGRIRALLRRRSFQEDNQRILEELKNKELETVRAKAAQEAAEVRAALSERLAQTAEELQRSNKELEHFSYVVSHDLKAPLRAIGSLAGWISKDYADKIDGKGKEQLDLMVNRVKRMNGMIDAILQYSRVGRGGEEPEDVKSGELLAEIMDLLSPAKTVKVTIEPGMPVVRYRRIQLQQVLQNLLSNAIKYLDKPAGDIRVQCADAGEAHEFCVRDNGPGIDAKYHEKIFELFQTLVPRDERESTGVGLAVVKKIVENNGGRIRVESAPGKGSAFFFTVPKAKGPRP